MKKSINALLMLAAFSIAASAGASAYETGNGSYHIPPRGAFVVSSQPGKIGAIAQDYVATVNVNIGDPVKLAACPCYITSTGMTYNVGVTESATAADPAIFGVVQFPPYSIVNTLPSTSALTASAGTVIDVAVIGSVALVRVGNLNVTAGDALIHSSTAATLTESSATTGNTMTPESGTALVAIAAMTKTGVTITAQQLLPARIVHP